MKKIIRFLKIMRSLAVVTWFGSSFAYARNKSWFSDNPMDIMAFEKECQLLDKRMTRKNKLKLTTKVHSSI